MASLLPESEFDGGEKQGKLRYNKMKRYTSNIIGYVVAWFLVFYSVFATYGSKMVAVFFVQ